MTVLLTLRHLLYACFIPSCTFKQHQLMFCFCFFNRTSLFSVVLLPQWCSTKAHLISFQSLLLCRDKQDKHCPKQGSHSCLWGFHILSTCVADIVRKAPEAHRNEVTMPHTIKQQRHFQLDTHERYKHYSIIKKKGVSNDTMCTWHHVAHLWWHFPHSDKYP